MVEIMNVMFEKGVLSQDSFSSPLLDWYDKNRRTLPWREDPHPYHVWISEVMLQQTRVEAVLGYYDRFMRRLPDVHSLAAIEEAELFKLWEGLGYYSRARNLKKAAEILVRDFGGELPASVEDLLKLPGIGPYTAGAIASIAFRQEVPAVDGNVLRVMARITGNHADITLPRTRKEVEEAVRKLIPQGKAHLFNQALMEFGALVCVPNGVPKCASCPAVRSCYAHETQAQQSLPVRAKKKERRTEKRTVLVFRDAHGRVMICRRREKGLLAGMWEFPALEGHLSEQEVAEHLEANHREFLRIESLGTAKHLFTHIEWHMRGFLVHLSEPADFSEKGRCVWCDAETLKRDYALPSALKYFFDMQIRNF
ncbi:MAG: A/G-specific adenine glycosylase [Bacillota bacterium]|nr:A/G-specific adenine glycosylase [Bacillota bacterium]